jgi:DNA repair exonuclease SbcCD ATPase subunit
MKQVNFKKIQLKNFLSIGHEPIVLDFKPGIHIITGENKDKDDVKNGCGKSSIIDSIFYAIFGSPLREVKLSKIPNWNTNKHCGVSLDFDVLENDVLSKYNIVRGMKPSILRFEKDGMDISNAITETKKIIQNQIINSSPTIFEQCVIMCFNNTKPFLSLPKNAKRRFIEGLFRMNVFSNMTDIVKSDIAKNRESQNIEIAKLNEIENNLKLYKKQKAEQKIKHQQHINDLKNNKDDITKKVKNIEKELEKKQEEIGSVKEADEIIRKANIEIKDAKHNISTINDIIYTMEVDMHTLQKEVKEIKALGNVCIKCKRPFSEEDIHKNEHDIKEKEDKIVQLKSEITKYKKDVDKFESVKENHEEIIKEQEEFKHNIEIQKEKSNNLQFRLLQYKKQIKQYEDELANIQEDQQNFDSIIDSTQERYNVVNANFNRCEADAKILKTAKFVVSDEGAKSHIIKKMLDVLNERVDYYLQRMDACCKCHFNEFLEETILNENGQECSYFNFSNGERRRIDLSMTFSFMDIRRYLTNISFNFLFLDELLDTSLCSKGVECVLEILKDRVADYNESIYIISHKTESIKHRTGEIIYLEKRNGITRRIDYAT